MEESLIILLEWLTANGETEMYNFDLKNQNDFFFLKENEYNTEKKTTIQKIEEHIKENIDNDIQKETKVIRDNCEKCSTIEEVIDTILSLETFKKNIELSHNTLVINGNIKNFEKGKILFINDFSNEEDDKNNKIFSSRTEEIFRKMMNFAKLEEKDYYLMNLFFWYYPGNLLPQKKDLLKIQPIIEKLISILEPKMIVCLGNYSISTLIGRYLTTFNTHSQFFEYTNMYLKNTIPITSTFSPNVLLENKQQNRTIGEDLKKIFNI